MTSHIDQVKDILEQLTGYTVVISKVRMAIGVYISPSKFYETADYDAIEYFDVSVIESTEALLAAKKKKLLSAKNNIDFDYNDFDARGYITVSDGTDFSLDDDIVGDTSAATGTVYKIEGNILFLKTITGVWEVEDIIAKTATCLSAATTITFPSYLMNELIRYDYDIDVNEDVGGKFACWIRFNARWSLL